MCGYRYEGHSPSSYTLDAENRDAAMSQSRITNIHTRGWLRESLVLWKYSCSAFKQNQEAERMVVSCKTLGTKISQKNREDYDSSGIKISHMPPSSVKCIQRTRSKKLDMQRASIDL